MTLTFEPVTPKSIGIFYSISPTSKWSLKKLSQEELQLLIGKRFSSSSPCDLWPIDPKINRDHLLSKLHQHMKYEHSKWKGSPVIDRKRSVTDGRTDWRTDRAKPICLPQKGGDINICWQLTITNKQSRPFLTISFCNNLQDKYLGQCFKLGSLIIEVDVLKAFVLYLEVTRLEN